MLACFIAIPLISAALGGAAHLVAGKWNAYSFHIAAPDLEDLKLIEPGLNFFSEAEKMFSEEETAKLLERYRKSENDPNTRLIAVSVDRNAYPQPKFRLFKIDIRAQNWEAADKKADQVIEYLSKLAKSKTEEYGAKMKRRLENSKRSLAKFLKHSPAGNSYIDSLDYYLKVAEFQIGDLSSTAIRYRKIDTGNHQSERLGRWVESGLALGVLLGLLLFYLSDISKVLTLPKLREEAPVQ